MASQTLLKAFGHLYYILLREPRIFTPTITTPHKWGTVGSGLTPGSRPDGRTPEIPDPDPENPEKLEKPDPPYFALLWPSQGTFRNGRGTHGSGLT